LSPEQLLDLQRSAEDDDRFHVLDMLQDYVNRLDSTRNFKVAVYNTVRSFFLHNRCDLPRDRFNIQNAKPPVVPRLRVDHVRRMVLAATIRDRSIILTAFEGFMGQREVEYVNHHCWPQIRDQRKQDIIRVDLPGRKRNSSPYYTFIGGDALQALHEYIGDTLKRKAVWMDKFNQPLTRTAFYRTFFRLGKRVGYVPSKVGNRGSRYGFNPHEMRDIARSLWHQSGADRDVAEFMMGHTVDPLRYDKIYTLDPTWVQDEYRKALPYLNILTGKTAADKKHIEELKTVKEQLLEMQKIITEIQASNRKK